MKKEFFNKHLFKILLTSLLIVLIWGGFWAWGHQKVEVSTEGIKYDNGAVLRVKIKNFLFRDICFSSCYPYYLEWKSASDKWTDYSYEFCSRFDVVEKCIKPAETKLFELSLPRTKSGFHRIAIPACISCQIGKGFQEYKRFYSNEFEIK